MKTDKAVSDVVGTIILVSILVLLSGIVLVFVMDEVSSRAEYVPIVSFQQSASTLHVYHAGGDTLSKSDIRIFYRADDITDYTTIDGKPWEFWKTGDLLYLGNTTEYVTIMGKTSTGRAVILFEGMKVKKVSG